MKEIKKCLFLPESTHQELKLFAVKNKTTIIQAVQKLLDKNKNLR
jgi:hypothetical protein